VLQHQVDNKSYEKYLLNQTNFDATVPDKIKVQAGSLPIPHRDPFDRMIMAQAELESLPLITDDKAFQTGLIQVIPSVKERP
jgi:PIN domain nuclease of toxin-antitoxin system